MTPILNEFDAEETRREEPGFRVGRWRPLIALFLIVPAQSLGVGAMLLVFPGVTGKMLGAVSRFWMLAFPVFWTLGIERRRPVLTLPTSRGLFAGILTGLPMFLIILGAYALVAQNIDLQPLRNRARETGFDQPYLFLLVFVYIVFINSFLEEYVWRWFVFRQIELFVPAGTGSMAGGSFAALGSALLFTVHHVVALFAWVNFPIVVLGSVGVFLGALVWSLLFAKYRSLWPGYLSHVLADLAILVIGFDLLFRSPH